MLVTQTGMQVGLLRRSIGAVLMSTEGARFRLCLMIVMLDSATGRRAGPTAKRVGAATTMHGAVKMRRLLSHTTAQLATPTGQRAGRIRKNSGAARTQIKAAPRPASCTTVMLGMRTGKMGGHTRRSSGAVGTRIGHVIRMIAKQILLTGKSFGDQQSRIGAAITSPAAVLPPQHLCLMTAMLATLIGMLAGPSARNIGVVRTMTVAAQNPRQHRSPMIAKLVLIIGRQAGLMVRNIGAVSTTTGHAIGSTARKIMEVGTVSGQHQRRFFAAIDTGADAQRLPHRSLMIVQQGTVIGKQAGQQARSCGVASILDAAVALRPLCHTIAMLDTAIGKQAGQIEKKHGAAITRDLDVRLHPCHMTAMLDTATTT